MKRNQRGLSLLEPLIAIALLSILIVPASAIISYCSERLVRDRLTMSKTRTLDLLVRIAGMPAALRAASQADDEVEPYNGYFKRCLLQESTSFSICYNRNNTGDYYPFRLYLPVTTNKALPSGGMGFITSGAVTGTPTYPIRFSAGGDPCDTSTSQCATDQYPIEAYTEFLPICPSAIEAYYYVWTNVKPAGPIYPNGLNPLPTCYNAKYIKVKVTVRLSDPTMAAASAITKTVVMDANFVIHKRQ